MCSDRPKRSRYVIKASLFPVCPSLIWDFYWVTALMGRGGGILESTLSVGQTKSTVHSTWKILTPSFLGEPAILSWPSEPTFKQTSAKTRTDS